MAQCRHQYVQLVDWSIGSLVGWPIGSLVEEFREMVGELIWFDTSPRGVLVKSKDDLQGGGSEIWFMVNSFAFNKVLKWFI